LLYLASHAGYGEGEVSVHHSSSTFTDECVTTKTPPTALRERVGERAMERVRERVRERVKGMLCHQLKMKAIDKSIGISV
jgi:hypothetical protein